MKKLMMMVISAAVLAGCSSPADRMAKCEAQGVSVDTCYAVEQNRQTSINAAAEKQALENAQAQYPAQKAQAAHVADPMREATLTGPGVKATVSNGFFNATINGKKAAVKRFNANYYEISGAGYTLSLSLNSEGIESASYTKAHSKANGILQVKQ
ncbi:hypothetical protein AC791_14910 [Klebsiella sp. RIT-PI-d]|uniref:hypothetical protein n=1 Tax=Klebsiella sp. RIT-PI-d TaxID=1681196 RepID=UPI0006764A65|nr:hypothetical protein [Klebsiella sp. RIT-PI-d]KNC09902.1 hypothetical protein AC791_14910 [Klebsiella sp. RIT-PI-d]